MKEVTLSGVGIKNIQYIQKNILEMIDNFGEVDIIIRKKRKSRTLTQNALFHKWCGEISDYLVAHGREFADPEWVKSAMKHSFLGYVDVEAVNVLSGEVSITSELRRTSKLGTGEMFDFMCKVDAWASQIGVILTIPQNSEYNDFLKTEIE